MQSTIDSLFENVDNLDVIHIIKGSLCCVNKRPERFRLYLCRNANKHYCFLFRKKGQKLKDVDKNLIGAIDWLLWEFDIEQNQIYFTSHEYGTAYMCFAVDSNDKFLDVLKFFCMAFHTDNLHYAKLMKQFNQKFESVYPLSLPHKSKGTSHKQ